jgi:hypothetical protein
MTLDMARDSNQDELDLLDEILIWAAQNPWFEQEPFIELYELCEKGYKLAPEERALMFRALKRARK